MGTSKDKCIKPNAMRRPSMRRTSKSLLPTLMAVGGAASVFASPASALELGQLQLESTLGQPLRASIAYALNSHEELYDFCVFLNKGVVANGLPTLTKAQVSITDSHILLSGAVPIREPLLSMRLTVDCPYTATLARDYMLMINPPQVAVAAQDAATAVTVTSAPPTHMAPSVTTATQNRPGQRPTQARVADESPIQIGIDYRVQIGDSLSGIASRIENRPMGLWPAVEAIFNANPDAFSNNDMDRLQAGSVLIIPHMQNAGVASNTGFVEKITPERVAGMPADSSADENASVYDSFVDETALLDEAGAAIFAPEFVSDAAPVETNAADVDSVSTVDDTAVLESGVTESIDTAAASDPIGTVANARPGDVFVDSDIPADASVETTAAVSPAADGSGSWLMWLGGTGFALILGLLIFGRKLRQRFSDSAAGLVPNVPARRITDGDATQKSQAISDVDFQFDDAGPGDRAIVLDADLGEGTGFTESTDMDVAQEFSFSAGGESEMPLDLDITGEARAVVDAPPTDVIPVQRIEPDSILDSEIPPSDHDDESTGEYDLSMIVDATRQAVGDMEGTAKDLMAVQLSNVVDKLEGSSYTLSKEVDYKILEQDYEEEFTQTQALNNEIARAALELAEFMDVNDPLVERQGDTAELPMKADLELTAELTAELPTDSVAVNEEFISDLDDTGVNEELTAEMPISNDETVEMDVESATIDTKKLVG